MLTLSTQPLYNNLSSEKDSEMNVLNNEKFQLH